MTTTLGDRIRELRKKKGFTLDELAAKAESSKSYIWELENKDPPRPSGEKLALIAAALDVATDYLLGADTEELSTAEDKAFFRKYYDPKNVTLILSGDIDKTAAASLVKKYFGTIQSHGKDNTPPDPKPVTVSEEAVLSHDDPLLKEPVLLLRWLTPPTCSAEDRTADVLATILSRGKQGRLHKLSQKWPEQILSDGASQDSHRLQSVFTVHIAAKDRGTLEHAKELVGVAHVKTGAVVTDGLSGTTCVCCAIHCVIRCSASPS